MLSPETWAMIGRETINTLYMAGFSTLFGYVLGLPWGIVLAVTGAEGIKPNKAVYRVLDIITNIMRSIPFLILLILIIPLTRLIVGKSYGSTATIVPLVVSAAPFIARMVESSLKEVDHGVIEAAQAMGANVIQVIRYFIIPETLGSVVLALTTGTIGLLGASAMAGYVGGGGVGDLALTYGYEKMNTPLMILTVIILVVIVQLIQLLGSAISRKLRAHQG